MSKQPKTVEFKAEVKQILDLMIHSLYSHKEIFLRELISNSADALDKIRYQSLTNKDLLDNIGGDFKIKITVDKVKKIISIEDNGLGMNEEELIENLGTIAKSGTKEFMEKLKKAKKSNNPELIGQFGVGFYSAFMVADKITVMSRKAGEKQGYKWVSEGEGVFNIEEINKECSGTIIELHIKDEEKEYLEDHRLKSIVKKYSDFVEYPIVMDTEKTVKEGDKEVKKIEEVVVNTQKALWLRSRSEIKEEQYNEFYKQISHDYTDPLLTYHLHAEGVLEYKMLLFIPSKAPFNLFHQDQEYGVSLYIKRVFIMHNCKELLPQYLRFVKGVVDSSDLPLNVSREILQDNPLMHKIQKTLIKKILGELEKMKNDDYQKYLGFYNEFGRVLKEGVHFDFDNKDKITDLLLFKSSKTKSDEYISLKQYLDRKQKDQKNIYYITGPTIDIVEKSPHMESFRKKDIEVLYLTDPIDEWIIGNITEYGKLPMISVTKGDSKLEETKEEKADQEKKTKKYASITEYLKNSLRDEVKDVRVSKRLVDSPVCLVADEGGMTAQMEQMMRSMGQKVPEQKKILEINLNHPLFKKMQVLKDKDSKNPELQDYARLLLDQANLAEGNPPKDMSFFLKKLADLMAK